MKSRVALLVLALMAAAIDARAGLEEGLDAYQRKDWPQALRELRPLAEAGEAAAQSRLGHMLLNGNGIPRDIAEAVKLLTQAVDKGDALAQNTLGGLYFRGVGVPKDVAQALVLFTRAAEQNQPNALNNLGQLYLIGNGVAKNETKALEYLRRAADQGISASWESLGIIYWHGRGVPADHAAAIPWLRKAAESGRPVAQNLYGAALWTGDGVAQDRAEGLRWFERSGAQGDASSLLNAAHAYLNGLAGAKDPEKAYFYYLIAERQAKAKDKAKFTAAKDKARLQVSTEQEVRAVTQAATWRPRRESASDSGDTGSTPNDSSGADGDKSSQTAPSRPKKSAGSGLVINRNGAVLTNSHVVQSCRNIQVILGDGTQIQAATVQYRDAVNDLALLATSLRPDSVARFREDKPMRPGDNVVAVGFPLSSLLSREPNVTAGVISAMNGLRGDRRHYQVTAPIQRGNSGGPLADMSGNVVGIVVSTLNANKVAASSGAIPQNVNFAIKAELARTFLDGNDIKYETAPAGTAMSVADVGEIIRKVAVFVECDG